MLPADLASGHTTAGSCQYDYRTQSKVTVVADNEFLADYSEDDTNRGASCMPAVGASCHSAWTMDLKKQ